MPQTLAVTTIASHRQEEAALLAQHLSMPFYPLGATSEESLLLVVTSDYIELRDLRHTPSSALHIDFVDGALGYRRQHGGGRRQPLAKAVGIRPGINPSVIDATAGLGRDAFVLACLGCSVLMIERSPVVNVLLGDALLRASRADQTAEIVAKNLCLLEADSVSYLSQCDENNRPEVVYLDPMYPERKKSALVKKEMQFLQTIVGADMDTSALLNAALLCARRRVVVKRPSTAPHLDGPKPNVCIESKNTRYDVYLC